MRHPASQVSFDLEAFDNLVKSQGVRVKHLRAMPDPRGLQSRGDYRREHPQGNSDGYIYKEAGTFIATFTSNDNAPVYEVDGQIDASNAYLTPPRYYEGTEEPVIIGIFDRFEICDIELRVVTSQLVECSNIGRDRLAFPATCIEHLIGADGFEYKAGTHFKLNSQGEVEWTSQTRPSVNTDLNKGEVYSVRYRYMPFFVVRRLLHEVRVAQVTDAQGVRKTERLPYSVQVARENVFRDTKRYSEAPIEDPRFQNLPSSGTIVGGRGT
jgi:hypothetical protein